MRHAGRAAAITIKCAFISISHWKKYEFKSGQLKQTTKYTEDAHQNHELSHLDGSLDTMESIQFVTISMVI
jgi:hypothetical protein